MTTKTMTIVLAGLALGLGIFIVGCSSDEKGDVTDPVTEEIIAQIMDNSVLTTDSETVEVAFADEVVVSDEVEITDENIVDDPLIKDMLLKNNVVYSLLETGIVMHNLSDGVNGFVPCDEKLNAMVDLGDKIIVGGNNLYTLQGDFLSVEDFDLNLKGSITALEKHGSKLMVGTTAGFYQIDINGIRELAVDINVSHIASSDMCVWVGTAGEGLYYYNGDSFRKRYLQRDSSLFDNTTALQFHHNHLYLGTDNGLFVYDGGRWQPYGLADGLPSENITAISAEDWVIKIGTDNGAVTFFNNEFKTIKKFEGLAVTNFIEDGKKLIAATDKGLIMKSGGLLTTLYDGTTEAPEIAFEDTF
ncbi:MAG: hypothetical protein KAR42_01045 [candidate division Zixibacteria bacterium]|nr:hypothetical protein [candidate division Zixibacteria bacterium]